MVSKLCCFQIQLVPLYDSAALDALLRGDDDFKTVASVGSTHRHKLVSAALAALEKRGPAAYFHLLHDEEASSLSDMVKSAVDAFFDNDLMQTTRLVLSNSKGSFGLCINSSMDAHRQLCVAARGQTMSVAFYPETGLILYGSEQAAVKAALGKKAPAAASGGMKMMSSGMSSKSAKKIDLLTERMNVKKKAEFDAKVQAEKRAAVRLDLDDLGGEICLLDWGEGGAAAVAVSRPNASLQRNSLMDGKVTAILHQEGLAQSRSPLTRRMVKLQDNEFVLPLPPTSKDPVALDLSEIPRVLKALNDDWNNKPKGTISLNRLTAWNLSKELKTRLRRRMDGKLESNSVDILVTGCEVSLWLGEQFASDLQSSFPKMSIKAVSSNKILGLFGQDFPIPLVGHPSMEPLWDLKDTIVIIVSHSGGTFAPLACSNLMKAKTDKIFVVASEWDTQVGKQLRKLSKSEVGGVAASNRSACKPFCVQTVLRVNRSACKSFCAATPRATSTRASSARTWACAPRSRAPSPWWPRSSSSRSSSSTSPSSSSPTSTSATPPPPSSRTRTWRSSSAATAPTSARSRSSSGSTWTAGSSAATAGRRAPSSAPRGRSGRCTCWRACTRGSCPPCTSSSPSPWATRW
jgi:hypothetical protein